MILQDFQNGINIDTRKIVSDNTHQIELVKEDLISIKQILLSIIEAKENRTNTHG